MSQMVSVPVIRKCNCARIHRSHLEFAMCAWPSVKWTAKVSGEFAVIVPHGEGESIGTLYRSLREAERRYATLQAFTAVSAEDPRTTQLWAVIP